MSLPSVFTVDVGGYRTSRPWTGPRSCVASLERFGTTIFGCEVMDFKSVNEKGNALFCFVDSTIVLTNWYSLVPKVYHNTVLKIVTTLYNTRYHKTKAIPVSLALFVADLHQAIWNDLEPQTVQTPV